MKASGQALATTPGGDPLLQTTTLHTDNSTAAVVWIHQSAARFELHPGYSQPGGGAWSQPDMVPPGSRAGLVATWNGGFLMRDSGGGFYLDGKQTGGLVPGVASEVFRRDGSLTVGIWGRDATMGPDIVGVRQQRGLLVDAGRVAADIDDLGAWGATDAGATHVRRSGVGVTAQGDVVYVIGRAMSPRSLATALQQAGAVRAMQLDINISWPSFMAYDGLARPPGPPALQGRRLPAPRGALLLTVGPGLRRRLRPRPAARPAEHWKVRKPPKPRKWHAPQRSPPVRTVPDHPPCPASPADPRRSHPHRRSHPTPGPPKSGMIMNSGQLSLTPWRSTFTRCARPARRTATRSSSTT